MEYEFEYRESQLRPETRSSQTPWLGFRPFVFVGTEDRKVVFTGSDVLIEQMERYGEEIPFVATIKKVDRYYTLS